MYNKHERCMILRLKVTFLYCNDFKLTTKIIMYLAPKICIL